MALSIVRLLYSSTTQILYSYEVIEVAPQVELLGKWGGGGGGSFESPEPLAYGPVITYKL